MMIDRNHREGAGRLLVLAAQGGRSAQEDAELGRLFGLIGEAPVRDAARRNKVEALVGEALVSAACDLSESWLTFLTDNAARVERLIEACAAVGRRLSSAGCRHAVIESGGTLLGSNQPAAAFGSGDFDVLVEPGRWDEVLACFAAEGFVTRDRRSKPTNRAELFREDGLWLSPGESPFDRMWMPLAMRDPTAEWLTATQPSRKAPDAHVLSPEYALAQVAIHTSLHSYVRSPGLRLHVDVDRLARDNSVDWDRVVNAVSAVGAETRAFGSLTLARQLLGTPVPESVTARLSPGVVRERAFSALISRAGVLADGRPKLPHVQAIALDAILDDHGLAHWTRSALLPSARWMRAHFDDGGDAPVWQLHARRFGRALGRWRPE